jgi:alkylation response protein AidB-like acyl-CoA dehydrogenase
MDIVLSEVETLLRDSLQRMLGDRYDFTRRQAIAHSEIGMDRTSWQGLAELGILAAPIAEEAGGAGLGPRATMIVAEEFGRRLVLEPFFESVAVVGGIIERSGTPAQRERFLPDIAAGEAIWALAATEHRSRHAFGPITTKASRSEQGFVLQGAKAAVPAAPWAERLLVSARIEGEREGSLGLFVVDAEAAGLSSRSFRTIDGRRAADLNFDSVIANEVIGSGTDALDLLESARMFSIAAQAAEAVGVMDELVRMTVAYAKTRKQFGTPIGSFQALQHRMVDMFIALQETLSLRNLLTQALSDGTATPALAAATKAKAGEAGRFVGEQAVQIHGGMGMSDELIVGHYLKRLTAINIQFGDPTYHLARLAEMTSATRH